MAQQLNEDEARAGETGNHVRYILLISLVLIVIAFGAALMGFIG